MAVEAAMPEPLPCCLECRELLGYGGVLSRPSVRFYICDHRFVHEKCLSTKLNNSDVSESVTEKCDVCGVEKHFQRKLLQDVFVLLFFFAQLAYAILVLAILCLPSESSNGYLITASIICFNVAAWGEKCLPDIKGPLVCQNTFLTLFMILFWFAVVGPFAVDRLIIQKDNNYSGYVTFMWLLGNAHYFFKVCRLWDDGNLVCSWRTILADIGDTPLAVDCSEKESSSGGDDGNSDKDTQSQLELGKKEKKSSHKVRKNSCFYRSQKSVCAECGYSMQLIHCYSPVCNHEQFHKFCFAKRVWRDNQQSAVLPDKICCSVCKESGPVYWNYNLVLPYYALSVILVVFCITNVSLFCVRVDAKVENPEGKEQGENETLNPFFLATQPVEWVFLSIQIVGMLLERALVLFGGVQMDCYYSEIGKGTRAKYKRAAVMAGSMLCYVVLICAVISGMALVRLLLHFNTASKVTIPWIYYVVLGLYVLYIVQLPTFFKRMTPGIKRSCISCFYDLGSPDTQKEK